MGAVVPLYIKTAYHEEPSFASTKVVTTLFPKNMTSNLNANFKKCIVFRDAKASLLKDYNDLFDFEELNKLAIDYSDGVIAGCNNVDEKLLKYAADKNIPTLGYPGEDFQNAYEEFYDKI